MRADLSRIGLGLASVILLLWTGARGFVSLLGYLTAPDSLKQVLDHMPHWADWLFSTPWWTPGLIAAVVVGFLMWGSWPPRQTVAIAGVPTAPVPSPLSAAGSVSAPPVRSTYLEAAAIFSGGLYKHAHYRARFARSGRGGSFLLRYCASYGGADDGWSVPQVLRLHRIERFTRGEVITLPITSTMTSPTGEVWYFGNDQELAEGQYPDHGIAPELHYRGRVTFISDDDDEQHCYFVVVSRNRGEQPDFVGEHIWDHEHTWNGRRPLNGSATSLMT